MKKRLLIISSMVALAMVAGVASAWWTTGGSGDTSTTAEANFPEDLDIADEVLDTDADGISPGDDLDIELTVTNPNEEGTAYFKAVDDSLITVTPVTGTCPSSYFSVAKVTSFTDHYLDQDDEATATATLVMQNLDTADATGNQDGCKGAAIKIDWAVDNT